MSSTAIIFVILYFAGLILTFRHPYIGVATYIFEWHNHPPYNWWGDSLPDFRWSMIVAVVTLLSLCINYKKLKPLKNANYNLIFWLVALTIWTYIVSTFFAVNSKESYKNAEIFFKYTVQVFMMMFLTRTIEQHKVIIWVLILNVANFGKIAFERGSNRDIGVSAPNATGGNAVSAHVASMIPLFGLYLLEGKRWEKFILFVSLPLLVNLIILESSRGAFLALLVMGMLTIIWAKGKLRRNVIFAMIGAVFLFFLLGHESFWERQKSIGEYEQDSSAMSRFYLWKGALNMFLDNPMGVGGEGYQALYFEYITPLDTTLADKGEKTVHNTFLLVLVEWGFVGFFLFIVFLFHTSLILYKIRRDASKTPNYRYNIDSLAIQLGLIGILVAGTFHNRLYAEVIYWIAAIAVALRNIQVDQIETEIEQMDQ